MSAVASVSSFAASGSIHITNDIARNGKPLLGSTAYVGGGTWTYGTSVVEYGTKKECYSYYIHPTMYHYSRAKIGQHGDSERVYEMAGEESKATARGGWFDETHAYWGTD